MRPYNEANCWGCFSASHLRYESSPVASAVELRGPGHVQALAPGRKHMRSFLCSKGFEPDT